MFSLIKLGRKGLAQNREVSGKISKEYKIAFGWKNLTEEFDGRISNS